MTLYYSGFYPSESADGAKGSAAFLGALNTATVSLYKRSSTALTSSNKPNGDVIYTFATANINLSSITNGWSSTIPSGNDPLYVVEVTIASTDPIYTIPTANWTTPVILLRNGDDGLSIAATVSIMNVSCNYAGIPKSGQFPKTTQLIIYSGSTNVTSSATYSHSDINCSVTDNGAGSYTLNSTSDDVAYFDITASYASKSISMRIPATKVRDGSAAATTTSALTINNSSSYTGTQGGPYTLPVGPNGTITLSAMINYYVTTGSAMLYGKWQYRIVPGSGSWTDIGTETAGDNAVAGEPAILSINSTLAGPSSGANWEFQFVDRKSGSASALLTSSSATVSWGP